MPSPSNNDTQTRPSTPPPEPSATWFCKACHKHPHPSQDRPLKACARCRLAHYCNVECQRRDFQDHKALCKQFNTLQRNLRQSTQSLSSKNMFETHRGHFCDTPETKEHCRKLAEMGHELEAMADHYNVVPLLEKSLEHRLEVLRLNADDDMGMRELVPFTLLRLHRDDRCIAFIGHWLRRMNGRLDPLRQHERSQHGDWLYGEADRFDDVFGPAGISEYANAPIPFLIALCIIKLRIVARMEARTPPQRLEAAQSYYPNRAPDHMIILEQYFDATHRRNPSLLPALINPAPLRDRPAPVLKHLGGPSETYFALLSCYTLFVNVPGAVDRLIRRFGPNPYYEHQYMFGFA